MKRSRDVALLREIATERTRVAIEIDRIERAMGSYLKPGETILEGIERMVQRIQELEAR